MELPRYVVFKSKYNNKCLRYIHEDGEIHGFLQFSGEEVMTPYSKYHVEMAKNGKGLVHIRCCYNNKYWVRWSENHWWIVAGADETDEDQSLWTCTLFEPVYVDGDAQTLRFRHVQLGHYACLWRLPPPYGSCLFAGSASPDKDLYDVFTIIDWESLLILPKHIAFKGDNDYYLSARTIEGRPYLEFASTDIGDPTVGNEVFTTQDGSARIKSDYFGRFWRRSPNWILADSDDSTNNNSNTLFWPVRVDKNVVALRNLGNNNFCKRLTTEGKTSCLNAGVSTISREARLEVAELVLSRNIYNVNFRLMDARIYDQRVIVMTTGGAINMTQEPHTQQVKLSYTETNSRTWKGSVSLKSGVKITIESGVPFIADGKLEVSSEFSGTGTYEWGETESLTTAKETVYSVTVPARTRVTISMIATQGSCDVPFSYTQRDTLTDGKNVVYNMDDGVYVGVNCFNVEYQTKEEKL
ncbi:uncharacterized protein LOC100251726 [Vitis vinifera]|uniref:Agglutinin domain-containing protein n=1 Tax=Vitis vinifera TaxID=29760 RepID=D7U3H9_VITVI|eukprot:XP_002264775.1 PREDICTED: uncharacterized protein LOC100251726 [Vitis vinifera]